MKTFFDMAKDLEEQTAREHITTVTGVDFNPSYYKASKEVPTTARAMTAAFGDASDWLFCIRYANYCVLSLQLRIPADVIAILTLPPSARNYDMVQKVM